MVIDLNLLHVPFVGLSVPRISVRTASSGCSVVLTHAYPCVLRLRVWWRSLDPRFALPHLFHQCG